MRGLLAAISRTPATQAFCVPDRGLGKWGLYGELWGDWGEERSGRKEWPPENLECSCESAAGVLTGALNKELDRHRVVHDVPLYKPTCVRV